MIPVLFQFIEKCYRKTFGDVVGTGGFKADLRHLIEGQRRKKMTLRQTLSSLRQGEVTP